MSRSRHHIEETMVSRLIACSSTFVVIIEELFAGILIVVFPPEFERNSIILSTVGNFAMVSRTEVVGYFATVQRSLVQDAENHTLVKLVTF